VESLISIKTGEIDNKMPSEFSDSEAAFQEQKNLGNGCSNSLTFGAANLRSFELGAFLIFKITRIADHSGNYS
jgi:hypothetical protein